MSRPEQTVPQAPPPETRLHALDILRGLALFGMILVHFHQRVRADATGVEDLIGWGVYIFVEQKAWGTFALLFGAGFAILLQRLEARGQPVVAIFLRRLAMLAAFGVVADLAFGFQILFTYAVWGLPLLVLRRWPTPALLVTAALAASARPIAMLSGSWVSSFAAAAPLRAAVAAAAERGRYGALFSARWALFAGMFPHSWRDTLPDVNLALFIVGLLAIRHGVVADPKRHVRAIAGWMTFGAVSWAVAWTHGSVLGILQDQWLCFTYAGSIVLLLAFRPQWTTRLTVFGIAGRMALTNYMLQAAALDFLSSGYGAGLKLRPYVYPFAAVALFALVAAFSRAWLARYRFGPLEWVWRTVTYARVQPLRRAEAVVAVALALFLALVPAASLLAQQTPPPARQAGMPGRPPAGMTGPWNNDIDVYHVAASGEAKKLATFDRGGVSTTVRLADGRLMTAHQHFPADSDADFDKVAVHFSKDEGVTWTPAQVIRLAGLPDGMRFPFDPTLVPLPDGRVRLYFTSLRGRRLEEDLPAIYSAISSDGVSFTVEPGRRFGIERRPVIDSAVVLHRGVFHLYAPDNGERGGAPQRDGVGYHATSPDGLTFTRSDDVRVEGRRHWLGGAHSNGEVITFFGTGQGVWTATSRDGQTWDSPATWAIQGADPGAAPARDGGWIVSVTSPPRRR